MSNDISRLERGPRMSQAVTHGGLVYLAGQVGAPGESVTAQSKAILARIDELLAAAGSDKSRLLQAQVWLTDIGTFAEFNAVWDAWVDPANTPARACVEAQLASPDYRVEVMVIATRA